VDIRDDLIEGFRARLDEIATEDVGLIKALAEADEDGGAVIVGRRAAEQSARPSTRPLWRTYLA
jgi:hypothetical protein